jgi:hypothetical protein
MMKKAIKIKLTELPHRAEQLKPEELTGVFGGCLQKGGICAVSGLDGMCNCCEGLWCSLLDNEKTFFTCK